MFILHTYISDFFKTSRAYLLTTTRLPLKAKYSFLCLVVVWTSYAVANNLAAISLLGLNPLGIG